LKRGETKLPATTGSSSPAWLSLGLSEDFLRALIQHLDLFVDAFNALDDDDHASVATATSWSAT